MRSKWFAMMLAISLLLTGCTEGGDHPAVKGKAVLVVPEALLPEQPGQTAVHIRIEQIAAVVGGIGLTQTAFPPYEWRSR